MPDVRKVAARNSTNKESQTRNDERTLVIVGDSIIKIVQGIKVAKAVGHRVIVKPFPGATTRDMCSHVVPTIEISPDQILLHVGTNDLKSSIPNQVADAIVEEREFEIVISELTARNDV